MILKLRLSLLIITLSTLFYSCQKEYSLEGTAVGGTAAFTFIGTAGACTNAVIAGTYQVGTALGAANVVTIAVNVTTPGTYTATTAVVNGISFTGSGSFSATGAQTISLTGSGIPLAQGTFSFTPGTNGCSFPIIVSSGGGGSGPAVYTLNGAPGNCTSFVSGGTYTAGTPLGATNIATVSVNVTTAGTYTITSNTVNGVTFSATGSFTTTGTQLIQLTGSGTPLVAGSFNYTPGTNGCIFSITVSGAAAAAVFTYGGAPGTCTNASPTGTYTAGTALTALNTVLVNVNVTTIGTYTISTPVVNGISFTGSGSFTATGSQNVLLTGTGTPTAGGVSNYIPTNGCSFPITVLAITDFFRCTIDGVARTFNDAVSADKIAADTLEISGYETPAATSPAFIIRITKPGAITTGIYDRLSQTAPSTTFSLALYNDGVSNINWITALSSQTGAFSVTVTSYTITPNRITGTFTGTLYDNNGLGTGTKAITLGSFSLPYQ